MFTTPNPYREPLHDSLVLKSIASPDEVERLAAFNQHIHDEPDIDAMTHHLIFDHPNTRPEEWLFVEDEATGEIVSALCLIPWTWRYEDVTLRAGEMGIVGTLEAYRRQGLIRALDRRFKALLAEGGYDLSQIQGIPYYYRQFGYEYALPLEGGWHLELHQIPNGNSHAEAAFACRLATPEDIPVLSQFYEATTRQHAVHTLRSRAIWDYLLTVTPNTCETTEYWLVENAAGEAAGYFAVQLNGFGSGLNLREASYMSYPAARAALMHARSLAQERGKPDIRVFPAPDSPLIALAKAWGAHGGQQYAWQILIPDAARMLTTIAPVLERRVAASPFAGLSATLRLDLYRSAVDLRFEDGKLRVIRGGDASAAAGDAPRYSADIPPHLLPPLVLGYRSREALAASYPDCNAWGESGLLLDVLFPQRVSYIYPQY